jgi:hypothetical protein
MALTVSATCAGKVASGHVGTPAVVAVVVAGVGEFARSSAHPPPMTISAQRATSAALRRLMAVETQPDALRILIAKTSVSPF